MMQYKINLDILNSIAFIILYQFMIWHIFYHIDRVLCIPTPIERYYKEVVNLLCSRIYKMYQ